MMRAKVIDLFCGGGGFSLSATLAGFEVTTSVDIDPMLTHSHHLNFPNSNLFLTDIATLSGNELVEKNGSVPDGIIGGPPCQGFSLIGKRDVNDSRNNLLWHFFRIVNEVQPKFFVMENVPGLLSAGSVGHLQNALDLVKKDYHVLEPTIFDASEYGAATKRKRVFVIGYKPSYLNQILMPKKAKQTDVRSALAGLIDGPLLSIPESNFVYRRVSENKSNYLKKINKTRRGLGHFKTKKKFRNGLITDCPKTVHTENVRLRFSNLKPGETDSISRFNRLVWSNPANTLRAGTGREKGSFQAARPIHPKHPRVITVREAARIQGFPDWYLFHHTVWHSFRMIGNSVAPVMGTAILKSIRQSILYEDEIAA